jgi:ubiquinone/menaquinone biosynthesis C-methylase UbiE
MTMRSRLIFLAIAGVALAVTLRAQEPDARQIAEERRQAEHDAPPLVEMLEIKPGMTVADVGSGGGAMTVVLGLWNTTGHVFATDVTERALRLTREYIKKEGLTNVTVIEGAAAATNLPNACCEAIFLRNVYHHITAPDDFNKSLLASLKPGGRLAIIDLEDRKGGPGAVPKGVRANRGGHGIPPGIVTDELKAAGFTYVRTMEKWPPGEPTFVVLFEKVPQREYAGPAPNIVPKLNSSQKSQAPSRRSSPLLTSASKIM